MEPGGEVSDTVFVLAFHDQQPRFESWNLDYRFAAGSGGVDVPPPAPAAPAATRQPETRTSAQQENLFWQSIMNSKNAAEFEAYLAQFPEGVFPETGGDPAGGAASGGWRCNAAAIRLGTR